MTTINSTIASLRNLIKSVNLETDISVQIVNADAAMRSGVYIANLFEGNVLFGQITSLNHNFEMVVYRWLSEHAAGCLPEPKSHANDYYDLVARTVAEFNERIQEDELTEDDDWSDALHEIVDNAVPHYYSEIFQVMAADGLDIDFDDSGMCPDTNDVTRICQARIYEQLYNDVANDSGIVWFDSEDSE